MLQFTFLCGFGLFNFFAASAVAADDDAAGAADAVTAVVAAAATVTAAADVAAAAVEAAATADAVMLLLCRDSNPRFCDRRQVCYHGATLTHLFYFSKLNQALSA